MTHREMMADLAKQAATLSPERRGQLESRLPMGCSPTHAAGVVDGLARAAEAMSRWPEAVAELRELAAVAAAHALDQERMYDPVRRGFTVAAHAEIDAEIARIESGEVEMIPADQVLRDMKSAEKLWQSHTGNSDEACA